MTIIEWIVRDTRRKLDAGSGGAAASNGSLAASPPHEPISISEVAPEPKRQANGRPAPARLPAAWRK